MTTRHRKQILNERLGNQDQLRVRHEGEMRTNNEIHQTTDRPLGSGVHGRGSCAEDSHLQECLLEQVKRQEPLDTRRSLRVDRLAWLWAGGDTGNFPGQEGEELWVRHGENSTLDQSIEKLDGKPTDPRSMYTSENHAYG